MEYVTINRFLYSDEGTFGVLKYGDLRLYSGELPWRNNKNDISCIYNGEYECIYNNSEVLKRSSYLIKDMSGRTGIRIHSANYMGDKSKGFLSELKGCISLGCGIGFYKNQICLTESKLAIEKFENKLNFNKFILNIKSSYNM